MQLFRPWCSPVQVRYWSARVPSLAVRWLGSKLHSFRHRPGIVGHEGTPARALCELPHIRVVTCRIEKSLEQLKHKSTDQVVELDKRAGVINRLKIERDALKVELIELNAQLEAFKQRSIASSERGTAKATRARSSRGRLAADSA